MVNHEFLSIFFDTYEDEWNEYEEGEVPRACVALTLKTMFAILDLNKD